MDGGSSLLLTLKIIGIAGATVALGIHQLWSLKKLKLLQMKKERAAEEKAAQSG